MSKAPNHIALRVFLLLMAIGCIIVSSILIFVKRQFIRNQHKNRKNPYTPVGASAPKWLREDLDKKINSTVKVRIEPRVFTPVYQANGATPEEFPFIFRMKAVDEFKTLQDAILGYNSLLETPPTVGVRDFLFGVRDRTMKSVSRARLNLYCLIYNRARCDPSPFTEADYNNLITIQRELLDSVNHSKKISLQKDILDCVTSERRAETTPAVRSRRDSVDSDDSQTALITLEGGAKAQLTVKYVKKDKGLENEAITHC